MAEDWFRKATWTTDDQAAFFKRLGKAREFKRPQYLFIQAVTLMESTPPQYEGAMALLEMVISRYPDDGRAVGAAEYKGKCLERCGHFEDALENYRLAISKMRVRPSWKTWAWLDLAWLVSREQMTQYFDEVWELIHEFDQGGVRFPVVVFRLEASRAFILAERGEIKSAAVAAKAALSAATEQVSGLSRHPSIGLVADIPPAAESKLRALAHQLV
jgi:tetratricopeptide (TPR) repeat protein